MLIWTAPSIRSCYKNACPLLNDTNRFTLHAARGEFVSMQVLLRNTSGSSIAEEHITKTITGAHVTQTAGPAFDTSTIRIQAQQYISFNDGIAYPDPISNHARADVLSNTTQSMWITFPVPETQGAGEYTFQIKFDCGDTDENAVEITLKVYDVTIPAAKDGAYLIEHFHWPEDQLMLEHAGYDCTVFDDAWWAFMGEFARSLRECRSNVYRIDPLKFLQAAGSRRISEDKWAFDFSLFDRMCDMLLSTGTAKKFSIDDPLLSWNSREIRTLDQDGKILPVNIAEPLAESWVREFFTALYAHIVSRSNAEDWIMHIQDEPTDPATWLWARERVRKYMPGLKCGNPISNTGVSEKLGDEVDLYIPLFNLVEDELPFFEKQLNNPDKEIWAYCCCIPNDSWYLNRFIDRPAIHSRLIGWATYSRGLSGYLHYGYNFWHKTNQFYPFSINANAMYKGDCMMVYPSPEDNGYRVSIRYINIRDGAQDFELLKLAEKADKEKALALSRSIAIGYKNFDTDERHFLAAREQLLAMAEAAAHPS